MGPVSSKNSNWKRVFWDGRNFALGQFCPQSRHLVRLAYKIGEVRFSTKIQTENVFFGKTNSSGLSRQNWVKFSSGTILPPNAPYSQLGQEKRYGAGFIKKFHPQTCFLGRTKNRSGTLLSPIAPFSPFGQENRWRAILYKNSNRKRFFWKNEFERAFEAKLSQVFDRNNFAQERTIQLNRPRKEIWGRFHQKIPTENVFFGMDETSVRDTFAPNHHLVR